MRGRLRRGAHIFLLFLLTKFIREINMNVRVTIQIGEPQITAEEASGGGSY